MSGLPHSTVREENAVSLSERCSDDVKVVITVFHFNQLKVPCLFSTLADALAQEMSPTHLLGRLHTLSGYGIVESHWEMCNDGVPRKVWVINALNQQMIREAYDELWSEVKLNVASAPEPKAAELVPQAPVSISEDLRWLHVFEDGTIASSGSLTFAAEFKKLHDKHNRFKYTLTIEFYDPDPQEIDKP